jgi:ribosomal protein S9
MANTKPIGVAYEDQNIINSDIVQATNIVANSTLGYAANAFDTVTQQNNNTTGVTINTSSGQITTANAQMAPNANAVFVVTCSACSTRDVVVVSVASGGTLGAYNAFIAAVANGSFTIELKNVTNNAYSEAIKLNYAIFHTEG